MEEKKLGSYVTIPRRIVDDWRDNKLTTPERNLLFWLRAQGNPYGIAIVELNVLAKETFNKPVDKNYINKLLLSLCRKKYIHYDNRTGRRGSFHVHLDEWKTLDNVIKRIYGPDNHSLVRTNNKGKAPTKSEVRPKVNVKSQRSSKPWNRKKPRDSLQSISDVIRGSDNDKDKDKDNNDYQSLSSKNTNKTSEFVVNSEISDKLKRIAESVGEDSMDFILGFYKKHKNKNSLWALERAAALLQDAPDVVNRGKWFNKVAHEQLNLY